MAQMVTPVKISAWGGFHGSLALVLSNVNYTTITKDTVTSTTPVAQPDAVNKKITTTSTPLKILTLQEETKQLLREFDLQEAVTNIVVQQIVNSIEEQYTKELNEEYFGYANNTIKSVLHHLQTNWCKVMTREHTDATEAFYQTWVPNMTHIITFGRQLTKQQKKCKVIGVIISDKAKPSTLWDKCTRATTSPKTNCHKFEILADADKTWDKTLTHFTALFSLRKAYGNAKVANSGFESAAHICDLSSACSIITASTKSDLTCNLYIKSLEESLAAAREYCASETTTRSPITPAPAFDPCTLLQTELAEQRK